MPRMKRKFNKMILKRVSLTLFFLLALLECFFLTGSIPLCFAQTFSDVPPDYWAYSYIEAAYKAGLTSGTSSTTFSPEQQVTRAQMAVFLARALKLPDYTGPQIFSDVPSTYWAYKQIGAVYLAGIASGTTSTTFNPELTVTRAQAAVFLARAIKLDTSIYDPNNSSTWAVNFTDVPPTYWAWKQIQAVYAARITSGTSSTTYSPDNPVTRAQMAVFLCRAFKINIPPQILSVTPQNLTTYIVGDTINISINASDLNQDSLQYRYLLDTRILRDWISSPTFSFIALLLDRGRHSLKVEVRDNQGGLDYKTIDIYILRAFPPPGPGS